MVKSKLFLMLHFPTSNSVWLQHEPSFPAVKWLNNPFISAEELWINTGKELKPNGMAVFSDSSMHFSYRKNNYIVKKSQQGNSRTLICSSYLTVLPLSCYDSQKSWSANKCIMECGVVDHKARNTLCLVNTVTTTVVNAAGTQYNHLSVMLFEL